MKKSSLLLALTLCLPCAAQAQTGEPLKVTTIENGAFAEGTVWYTMNIGGTTRISSNKGASYITLGGQPTGADEDLWCVTGNATDGYRFHNKHDGAGKSLIAPTVMTGTTGATAYAIVDTDRTGYTGLWEMKPSNVTTVKNGWFINEKGYANNRLNNRDYKLAFWTGGADMGSTITFEQVSFSFSIDMANGSFTKSDPTGNYASEWTSTATEPTLTLSTENNDFGKTGDGQLVIHSGSDGQNTVTLSAGYGYIVTGYTVSFKNARNGVTPETFTFNGKEYTATDEVQTVKVDGLKEPAASFSTKGENKGAVITDFRVEVKRVFTVEEQTNLFITDQNSAHPYRIPAIAKAANGDLIAISDYRPCGADIGYGEVDIMARISTDNGATWGKEFCLADGLGDNNGGEVWKTGFGDAAVAADAERNEIVVMMVCGKTVCWNGNYIPGSPSSNPNRVAQVRGTYNESKGLWEWTKPVEVTESIYPLFVDADGNPTVTSLFIGSGKICQSRVVKTGDYYRLYCATWTKNEGNRVIYSDDFGTTWHVLGTINDRPAPSGDEPKCEELPDGTVVLSSRTSRGRLFNLFTFTDVEKGKGFWGDCSKSGFDNYGIDIGANSTNGEILIVPVMRKRDSKEMYLALQSVPFADTRANVGIYYKELSGLEDVGSTQAFASNWDGRHQSSYIGSCYSTMTMQADGKLAFLYEEETFGRGYTTVYKTYTIEQLTKGAYEYKPDVNRTDFVKGILREKTKAYENMETGEAVGMLDSRKADLFKQALSNILNEYEADPSAQGYADVTAKMEEALRANCIQLQDGATYTLQNKQYTGKYLSTNGTQYNGSTDTGMPASQLFTFLRQDDGSWKIYNAEKKTFMSPTQAMYAGMKQVTSAGSAGLFDLDASADGWSALVCRNPVNASIPAIHLSGENLLVEWYASADASRWRIMEVANLPDAIETVEASAACKEKTVYDLQGRRLNGVPAKGVYITSDGKKRLKK